jgi:hypothetical protein
MKYRILLKYKILAICAKTEHANILIDKRKCILNHRLNRLPFYVKYEQH